MYDVINEVMIVMQTKWLKADCVEIPTIDDV